MNYFDLYSSYPDRTIASAWDSQIKQADKIPWIAETLNRRGQELFSRFAACHAELRALPRGARRSLQRKLARSSELAAVLPEYLRQGGRRLQHRMAWSLTGAALLLALGQGIVEAATITVTTTNPRIKRDGNCSLKEAIINANRDAATHRDCPAGSGADTIVLPANADITLRSVHNNRYGPTGLPVIKSPITIEGNGARIVRSSKKLIPRFRLMAVGNTGDLTLQDITLSGGLSRSTDTQPKHGYGGGALNYGSLTVEGSTISGNHAPNFGGGLFSRGTLTIENSTLSGNSARVGGGGVHNLGVLTIQSSAVADNEARYAGGGAASNYGTLTIENSTVSGNQGGGVFNLGSGSVRIANSVVSGNEASFSGGAVSNFSSGSVSIENSTISDNSATAGGGIGNFNSYASVSIENSVISGNHAGWAGGGIFNSGTVDVTDSIVSDNSASLGGGAFNSSSYISPNTLRIMNSTISGNEATYDGGGIFNSGSGCYYGCYFGGYLSLVDSAITQNVAGNSGGGLFDEGTRSMTNSTISNNQAPVGPDIFP